jgi:hypothetical protein
LCELSSHLQVNRWAYFQQLMLKMSPELQRAVTSSSQTLIGSSQTMTSLPFLLVSRAPL